MFPCSGLMWMAKHTEWPGTQGAAFLYPGILLDKTHRALPSPPELSLCCASGQTRPRLMCISLVSTRGHSLPLLLSIFPHKRRGKIPSILNLFQCKAKNNASAFIVCSIFLLNYLSRFLKIKPNFSKDLISMI